MEEPIKNNIKMNEDIRVQEVHACLLCNSKGILLYQDLRDRLFNAPGNWSLMRCQDCGLFWLNPQPIFEDIGKLYKTYFTHSINDYVPKFARLRRLIRNSVLVAHMDYIELADGISQKILGRILSWVGPIKEMVELDIRTLNGKKRGRLLDIGCGSGAFLTRMRNLGWNVMGIELDKKAVKLAREYFGLNIYEGTLEEANFSENEFDAITMNHVIEHLCDPITTLKKCYRILKPRGKLVIITPNIESLGACLFDGAWRGWEAPRHLHLFSPRTLRNCAERARLQVVKLFTTSRSAPGIWAASRLIRRNGMLPGGSPQKLGLWLRLEGLAFQAIEYGMIIFKNAGEETVLMVTK